MKLLIEKKWRNDVLFKDIGAKFLSGEDVDAPEGIELLWRYHDFAGKRTWVLVETNEASAVHSWAAAWSDFMDWSMTAVMGDEEAGAVAHKAIHG
jgi:hypothetical protein